MPNTIRLYPWELASMPEYSTSIPTGTVEFKMWRRDKRARVPRGRENELHEEDWQVCMYVPHHLPDRIGIKRFQVVLLQGPEPPSYHPPDWHNHAGYLRQRAREREEEWRAQSPGFKSVIRTARELRVLRQQEGGGEHG